ncbi:MAG: GIY-YIG nuclease family protein, partial [Bacteroidia bacterium]
PTPPSNNHESVIPNPLFAGEESHYQQQSSTNNVLSSIYVISHFLRDVKSHKMKEEYFLFLLQDSMKIHIYYIYILTNKNHTVLYTGVTNDLARRCHEHKNKLVKGFTEKYNVENLVYYEVYDFIDLAINREKQIKGYSRAKKEALINKRNPEWRDLYDNGKIQKPSHEKEIPDS